MTVTAEKTVRELAVENPTVTRGVMLLCSRSTNAVPQAEYS